jgi:two-component system chemotaxis response regulator CheY
MAFPEPFKVLVVDDNAHARAICLASLMRLGIARVDEASTGAEAILKLLCTPYGVVLMDWYMPDITGAGVLQVLRDPRFGQPANTPVILMTAYPSQDNVARGQALGVSAVLAKPFTIAHLGAALGRIYPPHAEASEIAYV